MLFRIFISLTVAVFAIETATADEMVWFDGQRPITYQVVGKTDPVVAMALQMLCGDTPSSGK